MKVAFFETEKWEEDYLKNRLSNFELMFFDDNLSADNAYKAENCSIISVFTGSKIGKDVFSQLPNLGMIATRSTGFDHIDLKLAKKNAVVVCNVPAYGENTVAEHTFGLLLNLSRKVYKSIQTVKEKGFVPDGLQGFDLKGKTIGIVGMGRIGQHVARIAKGFEMNILAYDVIERKDLPEKLGFSYVKFEDLLKNSDIITLHTPLNKNTHHLINLKNISLIKKGAYLINTSRGAVVETGALIKALEEGILAGAGLDVLEEECSVKEEREILTKGFAEKCDVKTMLQNHILMEHDNVIITPHNAFNSKEALHRILETTAENIKAFAKGEPINIVE